MIDHRGFVLFYVDSTGSVEVRTDENMAPALEGLDQAVIGSFRRSMRSVYAQQSAASKSASFSDGIAPSASLESIVMVRLTKLQDHQQPAHKSPPIPWPKENL